MLGSYDEAEDLVQVTLLRAWKGRYTLARRPSVRAWLYAIATNACLDHLRRTQPKLLPYQLTRPGSSTPTAEYREVPWLQPYPDVALADANPESVAIASETMTLAFLAAIQLLTPRQRAVLLLRDVVGWTGAQAVRPAGRRPAGGSVRRPLPRGAPARDRKSRRPGN